MTGQNDQANQGCLTEYMSQGYLKEDFRLFHLDDPEMRPMDFHYHTFHKIIVLLSAGTVYSIEGKSYVLEPGDMVLVGSGCIHRPELPDKTRYERFVLYISPEHLRALSTLDCDLETCFLLARESGSYVLRPAGEMSRLMGLLSRLEAASAQPGFGQDVLCRSLFLEFLILLTREMSENKLRCVSSTDSDEKIQQVLHYLNQHLTENITIDALAERFFISKYYLMRRFKSATGYTIHNYLTEKRLFLAQEQIARGTGLNRVCEYCGFADYSTFSRAYKKRFGLSPSLHQELGIDSGAPLE